MYSLNYFIYLNSPDMRRYDILELSLTKSGSGVLTLTTAGEHVPPRGISEENVWGEMFRGEKCPYTPHRQVKCGILVKVTDELRFY